MEKLKVELDIIHQQSIESISKNLSSIFTKEDVVNILGIYCLRIVESIKQIEYNEALENFEDYEKQNKEVENKEKEQKFTIEQIREALTSIPIEDYIETNNDSAEFTIRYSNELYLDHVDFNINTKQIIEEIQEELINQNP